MLDGSPSPYFQSEGVFRSKVGLLRKNEIWPFVAMWMELESVMLSEISQAEKDRYHMWILRNSTEDHGGEEGKKKVREGRSQSIRDS